MIRLRASAAAAVVLAVFMLGVFQRPVRAQSLPTTINFQGRLTDNNNNPLAGTHSFIFSIYTNSSGTGSPLWTETQSGISVTNGVLAVQLGAAASLTPSVFSEGNVWLQISVDGQALSPLQQLVAVPYAFNAVLANGKQYISSATTPSGTFNGGDLWYNPSGQSLNYWNGSSWAAVGSGSGVSLSAANTWTATQTFQEGISAATGTFSGLLTANGGVTLGANQALNLSGGTGFITSESSVNASAFFGNGSGLTGVNSNVDYLSSEFTSSAPLTLASSSVTLQGNVFNTGSELLQLSGGLVPTTNMPANVAYENQGNNFISSQTFSGTSGYSLATASGIWVSSGVYASFFVGNGAGLTGITAAPNVSGNAQFSSANPLVLNSSSVTLQGNAFNLGSELLQLSGGLVPTTNMPINIAYENQGNNFISSQTFSGTNGFSLATASGIWVSSGVYASFFVGNGAGLTGITAAPNVSGNAQFSSANPLVLNSSSVTLQGNAFNLGSELLQLSGGLVPTTNMPANVAYENQGNNFISSQTFSGTSGYSLATASGIWVSSGVYASFFVGNGAGLTGITAAPNVSGNAQFSSANPLVLNSSSVTLQGNAFNLGSELLQLSGGLVPTTNMPINIAYENQGNNFTSSQTFSGTNGFSLATSSGISVGAGVYASFFVGNGAGLTNINSNVNYLSSEFTSSAPLTLASSSVTLQGNVFNTGSELLQLSGGLVPTTNMPINIAYENQGNNFISSQTFSGTSGYSLATASGIWVSSGVYASFFVGNGAGLTGITAAPNVSGNAQFSSANPLVLNSSSVTLQGNAFNLGSELLQLSGGLVPTTNMPINIAYENQGNNFISSQTFSGTSGYSLATASGIWVSSGVYASFFVGNGAGLTGITAAPNVSGNAQFSSANPLVLNSSSVTLQGNAFNLGSELLQLSGGLVPTTNMPINIAYENQGNNFTSSQTFSGTNGFSLATSSGISVGAGVYASFFVGNGAGLTNINSNVNYLSSEFTSSAPLTLNSSSATMQGNVFNTGSELLQLSGGLVPTANMPINIAYENQGNNFISSQTFSGTNGYSLATASGIWVSSGVYASFFVGNGAGLSGITAAPNVGGNAQFSSANPLVLNSSSVTLQGNAFNLGSELLQLSGGLVPTTNMPINIAYENQGNNFTSSQTFSGTNGYSLATASGIWVSSGVYASFFVGNGAGLSGVIATVSTTTPLTGNGSSGSPLGLNSSSVTLQGNSFNSGSELLQLSGGLVPTTNMPINIAYENQGNNFTSSQTFSGTNGYSLATASGIWVSSGVYASFFVGNGAGLSGVIATVSTTTPLTGNGSSGSPLGLNSSSVTLQGNSFNSGSELLQLSGGLVPTTNMPVGVAYTNEANNFTSSQTITGAGGLGVSYGISAGSGTFTGTGGYSLTASSGIWVSSGVYASFFVGNGAGLTGVTSAPNVGGNAQFSSANPLVLNSSSVTLQGNAFNLGSELLQLSGGLVPTTNMPINIAYENQGNNFISSQTFSGTSGYSLATASGIWVSSGVYASFFVGNGAGLSGVIATVSTTTPLTGNGSSGSPLGLNSSSVTLQGNSFNSGSELLQLSGGLVPTANMPNNVAYENQGNNFTSSQTITGAGGLGVSYGISAGSGTFTGTGGYSLTASSGIWVSSGVYASFFVGNGAGLSGVTSAPNVSGNSQFSSANPLVLNSSSVTLQGNAFNGNNELAQLNENGNLSLNLGVSASTAAFSQWLTVPSATFTATGNLVYSVIASSGIEVESGGVSAPFFSGAFEGNGSQITNLNASNLTSGEVPAVALSTAILNMSTLQAGAGFNVAVGTLTEICLGGQCATEWPGGVSGSGSQYYVPLWGASNSLTSSGNLWDQNNNLVVESTMTVTGNAFSVGGSTLVVSNGEVGIGGAPAAGVPGLTLTGVESVTTSPQIEEITTGGTGNGYPETQLLGESHSNEDLSFDAAWNGSKWISGATSSYLDNYQLSNFNGVFSLNAAQGVSAGNQITWTSALAVNGLSQVGIGTTSPAAGAALTVAGVINASSATFGATGPNTYSITTSSGIDIEAGSLCLGGVCGVSWPSPMAYLASEFTSSAPLTLNSSSATMQGNVFNTGSELLQLSGGLVPTTNMPINIAYENQGNNFTSSQTFSGTNGYSLATASGIWVSSGVYASFFVGNGAGLSGVIATVSTTTPLTGNGSSGSPLGLNSSSVTLQGNSFNSGSELLQLSGGLVPTTNMPINIAYENQGNNFTSSQTFSGTNGYSLATASGIWVSSGVYASFFVGNGAGLSGVIATVSTTTPLTGNGSSGSPLGLNSSSVTLQGNSFNSGSELLQLSGGLVPTTNMPINIAYENQGNNFTSSQTFSGTNGYSLATASGIWVSSGVYASFFVGNGAGLSGVIATVSTTTPLTGNGSSGSPLGLNSSSVTLQGNSFNSGSELLQLSGGLVPTTNMPINIAYENQGNNFTSSQTFSGTNGYSLATASGIWVSSGVYASFFVGNGAGLSGVIATVSTTTPLTGNGSSGSPLGLNSSSVTLQGNSFNSGSELLQLSGGLVPTTNMPVSVAYTNEANNFTSSQTITGAGGLGVSYGISAGSGTFTGTGGYSLTASSGIWVSSGVYASFFVGNGAGLTGVTSAPNVGGNAQFSSANPLVLNSSSVTLQGNVFNTGSELLQLSGGLVPTTNMPANVAYENQGNNFISSQTFSGTSGYSLATASGIWVSSGVYASFFVGNGAGLSGVIATVSTTTPLTGNGSSGSPLGLNSSSVTLQGNSFNSESELLQLSGGLVPTTNMPVGVAYTNEANNFTSSQTITGAGGLGVSYGISAGSGTFTGTGGYSLTASSGIWVSSGVYASFFVGNGAGLTGVTSAPNVGGNAQFSSANPLVLNSSSVTLQGNVFNTGSELLQLSGGLVPTTNMPANVAYENQGNNFISSQTFSGTSGYSLATASGIWVSSGVYASFFVGNGAGLSGVIATVSTTTPLTGNGSSGSPLGLNSSSVTLQGNSFNSGSELLQLSGGLVPTTNMPVGVAYTNEANNFTSSQTITGAGGLGVSYGISAGSGTFTGTGGYSLTASSGIWVSSGVYASFFVGNGSGLTNVNSNVDYLSSEFTSSAPLTLNSSSATMQGNIFNGNNELAQLNGNGNLSLNSGISAATGTFADWLSASSATFTLESGSAYGVVVTSGVQVLNGVVAAPIFSGAFEGNGSQITNLNAAQLSGNVPAAALSSNAILNQAALQAGAGFNVAVGTMTQLCLAGTCNTTWPNGLFGSGSQYYIPMWGASNGLTSSGNLWDQSSLVVESTMTVTGSAFSVGGSTLVVAGGQVGIGTTSPSSALTLYGLDSKITGPDIEAFTSADAYPLFQELSWTHGQVALNFDSYWNGSAFESSSGGSNFQIYEHGNNLQFGAAQGVAAGNPITWNYALAISDLGQIGIGTTIPAAGAALTVAGVINASSATFTATGPTTYSITASSGIEVSAGSGAGVSAPFVSASSVSVNGELCLGGVCDAGWPASSGAGIWTSVGNVVELAGVEASSNVVVQTTMTVQGSAFSVGGSTLVVSGGQVGVGVAPSAGNALEVAGAGANTAAEFDSSLASVDFDDSGSVTFQNGGDVNLAPMGGSSYVQVLGLFVSRQSGATEFSETAAGPAVAKFK